MDVENELVVTSEDRKGGKGHDRGLRLRDISYYL